MLAPSPAAPGQHHLPLSQMRHIDPWFGLSADQPPADVVVIGCPFEEPLSPRLGTSEGPEAIRRWSRTSEAVTETGVAFSLRVHDRGDALAATTDRATRWQAIEAAATEATGEHPGAFLLGLGGDHSVTPPLVAAMRQQHRDLGFVMIDAHPDAFLRYQDEEDTHASVLPLLWDRVGIEPSATALLAVRSFAPEEIGTMRRAGTVINAHEWHAIGTDAVVAGVGARLSGRPLYVSIDLDGLDPACAPGVSYPVAGGPGSRAVFELLRGLWDRFDVLAMDIVELAPRLDQPAETTTALAAHLCLQVFGHVADARRRRAGKTESPHTRTV